MRGDYDHTTNRSTILQYDEAYFYKPETKETFLLHSRLDLTGPREGRPGQ